MVTEKQVEDVSVDTAEGMAWWNNMSERGRAGGGHIERL